MNPAPQETLSLEPHEKTQIKTNHVAISLSVFRPQNAPLDFNDELPSENDLIYAVAEILEPWVADKKTKMKTTLTKMVLTDYIDPASLLKLKLILAIFDNKIGRVPLKINTITVNRTAINWVFLGQKFKGDKPWNHFQSIINTNLRFYGPNTETDVWHRYDSDNFTGPFTVINRGLRHDNEDFGEDDEGDGGDDEKENESIKSIIVAKPVKKDQNQEKKCIEAISALIAKEKAKLQEKKAVSFLKESDELTLPPQGKERKPGKKSQSSSFLMTNEPTSPLQVKESNQEKNSESSLFLMENKPVPTEVKQESKEGEKKKIQSTGIPSIMEMSPGFMAQFLGNKSSESSFLREKRNVEEHKPGKKNQSSSFQMENKHAVPLQGKEQEGNKEQEEVTSLRKMRPSEKEDMLQMESQGTKSDSKSYEIFEFQTTTTVKVSKGKDHKRNVEYLEQHVELGPMAELKKIKLTSESEKEEQNNYGAVKCPVFYQRK